MLGSNCYMYVGRCMENLKIQEIYNRYVEPNVLYLSHMLLYIVFERLNGSLTNILMATYVHHPLRGVGVLLRQGGCSMQGS